ncbi:hypothetical protein QGN29_02430 [Temperatibacter marinus]|uniref:Uncharacterized protein n=1 Tax=Temperatibacter marinus TaxID=1456591 RepID=A0AA52EJ42_9PROT|nr:hypothetical protein [Temperatibacter marinus]WND03224.1 hypothetical protein QGN29_02430 [Temperatibacter marinus]
MKDSFSHKRSPIRAWFEFEHGLIVTTLFISMIFSFPLRAIQHENDQTLVILHNNFLSKDGRRKNDPYGPGVTVLQQAAKRARVGLMWRVYNGAEAFETQAIANLCTAGLIRTSLREKTLIFSAPIGYISTYFLTTNRTNRTLDHYKNFSTLLAKNTKEFLLISGASKGAYLEELFVKYTVEKQKISPQRLLRSIMRDPSLYTLVSEDTVNYLKQNKHYAEAFSFRNDFDDLQHNRVPYRLACTKETSQALLQRLNKALQTIVVE